MDEDLGLLRIDSDLNREMDRLYAGYKIIPYASGAGFGTRDISYDVLLKDGSRFIVEASYDFTTGKISIRERPYQKY